MSTTFDARDGNAPDAGAPAVALADEETLRRVFLEEYPALTEEARTDLGPDARALVSKVVEGAFVRAWDARARLRTPAEVHQFLVEDMHHAAARALSRRAGARRFAGGGWPAAVTPRPTRCARRRRKRRGSTSCTRCTASRTARRRWRQMAAHSRHEAAEHIKDSSKQTPLWIFLGIGALVLVAMLGISTIMGRVSEDAGYTRALNDPDLKPIATTFARMGMVTLDDGTKVRLSPESEVTVPKGFGPELRVVRIKGSGEFTVAKGIEQPFRVKAAGTDIVAAGTAFTVHGHRGLHGHGRRLGGHGAGRPGEGADRRAGGGAVVAKDTMVRQATTAEKEEADAWRSGMLVVNDKPLGQVLNLMKRWYGLTILVPQPKLMERKASFRASLDSTRQAIRGIEATHGAAVRLRRAEHGVHGAARPNRRAKKK